MAGKLDTPPARYWVTPGSSANNEALSLVLTADALMSAIFSALTATLGKTNSSACAMDARAANTHGVRMLLSNRCFFE
jgi:hypothetical protein